MRNRMLLMAIAAVLLAAPVWAYHDGGVAHCNGCHTMHNSQDSLPVNYNAAGTGPGTPVGTGWPFLLTFQDKSDVCLNCHQGLNNGYKIWADDVLVPNAQKGGGDYVFLEEDNINDGHGGATNPIEGYAAGHSIVSAMMGTVADPMNTTAPGGAYPSSDLGCTSCHDPHGTSSHRLLYQTGQQTISETGFTIDWDTTLLATGIGLFGPAESNTNHNVYNGGVSAWCSECHGVWHQSSGSNIHPSGENLTARVVSIYNQYSGSEDCSGPGNTAPCGTGSFATAYLAEVPFQDPDITDTSSTSGPDTSNSRVVCVSCHRAHASSARDSGRWDFNITGLDEDGVESGSYAIPNPFNEYQRSLCNKCHAQDELDVLVDFSGGGS